MGSTAAALQLGTIFRLALQVEIQFFTERKVARILCA